MQQDVLKDTMPATPNPVLTLFQPPQNSTVLLNVPFLVTGAVSDPALPEPISVTSVTVQVDGGPPVSAVLSKDVKNKNESLLIFDFKAPVQVTGGSDPHTVTVTAKNDKGLSSKQTRNVFLGVPFAVDQPAVLIDIVSFAYIDLTDPVTRLGLKSLQVQAQDSVSDFSRTLGDYHKMLGGPNLLIAGTPPDSIHPLGRSTVRAGFWIEDFSFPVIAPDNINLLTLPLLPDVGANNGFALVPFQNVPEPSVEQFGFAFSIPLAAMQKIANAALPAMRSAALQNDVAIDSVTVLSTSASAGLEVKGEAQAGLSIPFTLSFRDNLGTVPTGSIDRADPSRNIPAVLKSTHNSSETGLLNLLLGLVFPPLGILLQGAAVILAGAANDADKAGAEGLRGALASLPSLVPLKAPKNPLFRIIGDFPRLVVNWLQFGTAASGIQGNGIAHIDNRDSSMVRISVSGDEAHGTAADIEDTVIRMKCHYTLVNISPDSNRISWTVSGTGSRSGTAAVNKEGSFIASLPMPKKLNPGSRYPFTVTVSAVETSAINSALKISGSGSTAVTVFTNQGHKGPQQ